MGIGLGNGWTVDVIAHILRGLRDGRPHPQQLTGFFHAKRGFNLTSLIESMGMTEKEWKQIRFDASILGLNESEVSEIDEYFEKEAA